MENLSSHTTGIDLRHIDNTMEKFFLHWYFQTHVDTVYICAQLYRML